MGKRGRPKGPSSTIRCYRLNDEVGAKLDQYSDATGISKTTVVEKALLLYFNTMEGGIAYEDPKN